MAIELIICEYWRLVSVQQTNQDDQLKVNRRQSVCYFQRTFSGDDPVSLLGVTLIGPVEYPRIYSGGSVIINQQT